jgi:hypothetical protein
MVSLHLTFGVIILFEKISKAVAQKRTKAPQKKMIRQNEVLYDAADGIIIYTYCKTVVNC